ncbi:MAG: TIGR00153 family protein [Gammaproteobacteria bacterium]
MASSYLSRIFGSSPVAPLQAHMDRVYQCAKQLVPFFEAVVAGDWPRVEEVRGRITDLEHEADELKQAVRGKLPKSLLMPVARGDLLELVLVQDKIANCAKDISGLVVGRRIQLPPEVAELFLPFVARNVDAAKHARKSVRELDELYETGFRGAEARLVESLIEELSRIEGDTDRMQTAIRAALFRIEKNLPPVEVMFLYRIIELTGEMADMAQRVGRRLELLLTY